MVVCNECQDEGPYGLLCQGCQGADYGIGPVKEKNNRPISEGTYDIGDLPMGSCPLCGQEGIRGCLCSGCEDMSILYD